MFGPRRLSLIYDGPISAVVDYVNPIQKLRAHKRPTLEPHTAAETAARSRRCHRCRPHLTSHVVAHPPRPHAIARLHAGSLLHRPSTPLDLLHSPTSTTPEHQRPVTTAPPRHPPVLQARPTRHHSELARRAPSPATPAPLRASDRGLEGAPLT
jgi:hypothetical protein